MGAVLINNRNKIPSEVPHRLVMGNKQGPKLLGRHSDSRPNTYVSRRQLVEDYRNRNLHNRRSLIYSAKIYIRRFSANINAGRNILATINTISGRPDDF